MDQKGRNRVTAIEQQSVLNHVRLVLPIAGHVRFGCHEGNKEDQYNDGR
jgi:hypothetical protein